jgi:uncharacterized protein YukE
MTSFYVNHNSFQEANDNLASYVQSVGHILEELTGFLRGMNSAVQGQAAPLWEEQQNHWNMNYEGMRRDLNAAHGTSVDVQNIFQEGDRRGSNIMR